MVLNGRKRLLMLHPHQPLHGTLQEPRLIVALRDGKTVEVARKALSGSLPIAGNSSPIWAHFPCGDLVASSGLLLAAR
jgi:hypothetical protein